MERKKYTILKSNKAFFNKAIGNGILVTFISFLILLGCVEKTEIEPSGDILGRWQLSKIIYKEMADEDSIFGNEIDLAPFGSYITFNEEGLYVIDEEDSNTLISFGLEGNPKVNGGDNLGGVWEFSPDKNFVSFDRGIQEFFGDLPNVFEYEFLSEDVLVLRIRSKALDILNAYGFTFLQQGFSKGITDANDLAGGIKNDIATGEAAGRLFYYFQALESNFPTDDAHDSTYALSYASFFSGQFEDSLIGVLVNEFVDPISGDTLKGQDTLSNFIAGLLSPRSAVEDSAFQVALGVSEKTINHEVTYLFIR